MLMFVMQDLELQIESLQGKLHASDLKLQSVLESQGVSAAAAAGATVTSAPNSPERNEDDRRRANMRMSDGAASAASSSLASTKLHPLMKSPLPMLAESSDLEQMNADEQKQLVETLTQALQRKCDKSDTHSHTYITHPTYTHIYTYVQV